MLTDEEVKDQLNGKKGGKGLYWNTHEVEMAKSTPGVTYLGQWSKD